jgi:NADH-quinone oxidoreductase subunit N
MIDKLSWITVYPEIVLLIMACVIALVDLGVKTPQRTLTYVLTLLTLAVVVRLSTGSATWSSVTPWAVGSSALPASP